MQPSNQQGSRKQREMAQREQDILAAAQRLFGEAAGESASMTDIADALGVSKGTLYNHFASKDEIVARLIIAFGEKLNAELEQLRGSPASIVREAMAITWNAYRTAPHLQTLSRLAERAEFRAELPKPVRARMETVDTATLQILKNVLDAGTAKRRAGSRLPQAMAGLRFLLIGMSRHIWSSRTRRAEEDPVFENACAFALAGLGWRHD